MTDEAFRRIRCRLTGLTLGLPAECSAALVTLLDGALRDMGQTPCKWIWSVRCEYVGSPPSKSLVGITHLRRLGRKGRRIARAP